ncbi:MAG: tRNA 5-methoxyuridine(34)/uridine 5-oxyacetic acid(34) synthase CmoB [Planctomycetota bacterium]
MNADGGEGDTTTIYRQELDDFLASLGHDAFHRQVRELSRQRFDQPTNGDLKRWWSALSELPSETLGRLQCEAEQVRVVGDWTDLDGLRQTLMTFHPWRKGPFEFFGLSIDTEWRSDWKWDRFANSLDWRGKVVLDVGCGNGYFGWRMLDAGAAAVLGLDPILRFVMQFEVMRRYSSRQDRNFVVPLVDSDLPEKLMAFDVVVSAGVLYHRTSPIDHLRSLQGALKPAGTLLLETLIVDQEILIPEDRYAQMRNVWFIPSIEMLCRWMRRTGFEDIEVVDVTPTTPQEQRSTPWMTFQSLSDFLDPANPERTVEGYPAPVRATMRARRMS